MDRKQKIIELLEKKNLSEQGVREIEKLTENDKELKDFVSSYNNLAYLVSHSSHLTEEEIAEYVLYKNEISGGNYKLIAKAPFIEVHLRKCSKCSDIFRELSSEYSETDIFVSENLIIKEFSDNPVPEQKNIFQRNYKTSRYAFISVFFIGVVYLALAIVSSLSTPTFYKDAALKNDSEFSITRGRSSENFQNSLNALENNNYNKAIDLLQKDIRQNPGDETIFYSYYITGLAYLKTAGHNFLGLFPGYDKQRAEKGKEYLVESIQKNNSGKFMNITLNSYFYLAKASIMLNEKDYAKKYLSMVINGKGSKMEEAKNLLGELE